MKGVCSPTAPERRSASLLILPNMIRIHPRRISAVIACLVVGYNSLCRVEAEGNREHQRAKPNIIFFIADDMLPDMFNFLPQGRGLNLSPNLDRLAKEGMIFENQYVASPVCTPSRYNCLTGKYASKATNQSFLAQTKQGGGQTAIQWNTHITQNDTILPQYLRELGYVSGMVGKNHVIQVDGLRGFPDFYASANDPDVKKRISENYEMVRRAVLSHGFDFADGLYNDNPHFNGVKELAVQNMDWIAEAGLTFIEQNHDKPFFLYFATTIPHGPSNAESSWEADPKITAKGYLENAPNVLPPRSSLSKRLQEAGITGNEKERHFGVLNG